jgi:hypothetical protein
MVILLISVGGQVSEDPALLQREASGKYSCALDLIERRYHNAAISRRNAVLRDVA